jgi:hypothetical protein
MVLALALAVLVLTDATPAAEIYRVAKAGAFGCKDQRDLAKLDHFDRQQDFRAYSHAG